MLLALCGAGFAQTAPQWTKVLSDAPETFRTQLISSSESSIQVNVQVPGFFTTSVITPRGEAKIVSLPKSVSTAQAGEPNMPMTGIPAIIGDHARMDVRVLDAQYMDFEDIEVAPSKGDFPRSIDPEDVPYTYGECYNQDAFFPSSNLDLYEPYIIRDFRGQNMVVYPFAYNPVTKTLRVYYNMTVEMYKVDDNGDNSMEARKSNTIKMDPDFKSVYQRHFINYEASMAKYTPVDEEGDLLIICYDSFINAMTDFVNWKKTRGMNTTIVGTSTVGSTYSAIKTYIQNQYNANNNLTHVLLVGDVDQIPGYLFSGNYKGDNPYGQVVGSDNYNDVFIGRFSATNTTHVATQVQKVITYERDLTTSDTWLNKGLGVSTTAGNNGHNNEDDYQHIDNLRTDLMNYGYSTVYQEYYGVSGYSSTTQQISTRINSGVGIINYCNHGSETAWQSHSPYYSTSYVNALTNNNKLPFIFSVACLNGKYDYGSDCFAEAWMRATNNNQPAGAIGGMFSYISQPWIPPMWAQDEFVDILVESYPNNKKYTWGGCAINGLLAIFDHYSATSGDGYKTYQAWILYGDPTLMLRTKTPQAMTVTHSGAIPMGSSTYSINVTNGNGALATITNANHDILGSATVSNGTANISISSGSLIPAETLTLCVFGSNKVTYLGTITVTGGTQYNITCNQPEHGSISAPAQAYASSLVTLTATPETGYCLSSWEVRDATNHLVAVTGNTFIMPESDVTVSATFVEGLTITLASVTNGSISADPSCALQGTTINLTATPETGYNFEGWVVYKTGDVNTTVTVDSDSFTMPNYDVTVSAVFLAQQSSDVTIGSGTGTNAYIPTYAWYSYSLTQQIYTSAEVGEAGTITAVAFKVANSKSTTRNLDIYLSHTSTNTFSSTSAWISQSTSYRVFSGEVTFAASGWTTITLDTPFEYNGTSNLLLTVDDNTGSYVGSSSNSPSFYAYSTTGNTAIYKYNDGTNYNPASMSTTGTLLQAKNQVVLSKTVPSTDGYLSVSPDNLTGFTYAEGDGPSEAQSFALIGTNLQDNLAVSMPTGFEVSSNGINYSTTLSLTPANGHIQTMVYVRLKNNLTQGSYSGTMTLTSATVTQNVTLSGTVSENATPMEEQTVTFTSGWGWWSTYLDITLEQLEEALGSNCASITSQEDGFVSYINGLGWSGSLNSISPAKMYKLQIAADVSVTVTGTVVDPASYIITLNPGDNWIGYPVSQSMSLANAFAGANPVNGDKVSGYDGYAQYYNGTWYGELQTLQPGQGYIYKSNATTMKTFTFPNPSKSMK